MMNLRKSHSLKFKKMMLRCTKAKMSRNNRKKWNLLVAEEGQNHHHLFNLDNSFGLVVRTVILAYSHQ